MSAARKRKKTKKSVRFEVSRLALTGWCFGLFLALFWMFLLGLFVGKGITPANINFTEIKKRMMAEGLWPGSNEMGRQESPPPSTTTKRKIPLKDLEFYEKLAKKKKVQLQKPTAAKTPPKEKPPTTVAAKPPPPATATKKECCTAKTIHRSLHRSIGLLQRLDQRQKICCPLQGSKTQSYHQRSGAVRQRSLVSGAGG